MAQVPDDLNESQIEWAVREAAKREAARRAASGESSREPQKFVLSRIDVPIGDLVILMLKLTVASIPVALVVAIVLGVVRAVFLN